MATHREHDKLNSSACSSAQPSSVILFAVYNASRELAVVKEVEVLHELLRDRAETLAAPGTPLEASALAQALSTEARPVLPFPADGGEEMVLPGFAAPLPRGELEASRINEQGGYLESPEGPVAWAAVPLPGSEDMLLVAHRHRPPTGATLLSVYQNRLIIPALFYLWAAVWVSLILNSLVTRLRLQKDELERMAWYDALTGLPNRNLLFKRLDELVEGGTGEGASLSLAVVDLDGFKQVNDTFGHHAGDELLRQVAERFRRVVRRGDLVARTGGDEFVLLLTDHDPRACEAVCERILEALSEPYALPDRSIAVGASLGLARYPHDGRDTAVLTRKADQAMYEAKRSGGGIVCYSGGDPVPVGA